MRKKFGIMPGHKVLLFIVFIVLQAYNFCFSQELINVYKKYLPQKYINDPALNEQLSQLLESKSRIHPDLLYYYITYYNLLAGSETPEEKAECNNFKRYINSIENGYILRRNSWLEKQISILDTMKIEDAIKNRITDKIKQLLLNTNTDSLPSYTDYKIDENQVNFYTVLYLNPDLYTKYTADFNYKSIRENEEEKTREEIRLSPRSEVDLISLILDKWFIFKNSIVTDNYNSDDPIPAVAIENLTMREHSVKRQSSFYFGIGYAPYNQACNVKPSVFINGYGRTFDFDMKKPMQQIGVSLGYKYYLRDVLGLFSYLNAQLFYFHSFSSDPETADPGFSREYSEGAYNYKENLVFKKSDITPISGQSFFINISTPVYIILNTVNVEVGLLAGLNQVNYKFDYSYSYSKTVSYWAGSMWDPQYVTYGAGSGYGKNSYEDSEQRIVYSPIIGINFIPSKNTNANIFLSIQNISVFMSYGF